MNKKGDGEIVTVYWFAVLVIVAGGIFVITYTFYGAPYDVREIEARVLMNHAADCISYKGILNSTLISQGQIKGSENFLENCHLNFESDKEEYYIKIEIYKLEELSSPFSKLDGGNVNLLAQCNIQEKKDYKNLAQCVKGNLYSVDDANNQYIIKLLASVRKAEQNLQ